jgi:hypothetical protein
MDDHAPRGSRHRSGAHSRRDGAQPALGAARGANSCSVSEWSGEGRASKRECQARRSDLASSSSEMYPRFCGDVAGVAGRAGVACLGVRRSAFGVRGFGGQVRERAPRPAVADVGCGFVPAIAAAGTFGRLIDLRRHRASVIHVPDPRVGLRVAAPVLYNWSFGSCPIATTGRSFNGRTRGSGPRYRGSNPCLPANLFEKPERLVEQEVARSHFELPSQRGKARRIVRTPRTSTLTTCWRESARVRIPGRFFSSRVRRRVSGAPTGLRAYTAASPEQRFLMRKDTPDAGRARRP